MSGDPSAACAPDPKIPHDEIRERAYDLWDRHHRPEGYELAFWLMAERELKAERRAKTEPATAVHGRASDHEPSTT